MADGDFVQIILLITLLCVIYQFYQIIASANGDTVMWCMCCCLLFVAISVLNGDLVMTNFQQY